MKGKLYAVLWNFLHSAADILEEKILLQTKEHTYFFFQSLSLLLFTFLFSLFFKIELTWLASGIIILYSISCIGGDYCYVKAIPYVPIGLANLISSGGLFIILICDIILGYIEPKPIFILLFFLFVGAILIFSLETNKMKEKIKKKIDLNYILMLFISTIFYSAEPYFIKLINSKGANEWGINLVSSFVIMCWWGINYKKHKIKKQKENTKQNILLIVLVGFFYSITSFLYMSAYIGESPLIITLILQLQVFLVVIISVIQKTDKMNLKKVISLIVAVLCLVAMTFLC